MIFTGKGIIEYRGVRFQFSCTSMNLLGKIDQVIKELDQAQDVEAIFDAVYKHVTFLGFEKFSYQILKSPQGPRPNFYITAYPPEWDEHYSKQNYVSNDMVSRHAARVVRPFSWLEIGRFHDFTDDQKKVFNEASEFDINSGGTVPIHGPGLAKALFTVASSLQKEEFAKFFEARRHEIHIVATYMHERLMMMGIFEPMRTNLKLTPREIEILTWTARGKTMWEISEIFSIAETTIKTHLESVSKKLNAQNKTHAISIALIHGLIVP